MSNLDLEQQRKRAHAGGDPEAASRIAPDGLTLTIQAAGQMLVFKRQ